jgi:hypothetical protein
MKIILILSAIACNFGYSEELNKKSSDLIRSYNIEKNFKGFSYESENHGNLLHAKLLPGAFEDKSFVGVTFAISEDGNLSEIKPIFVPLKKSFEVTSWALDNFKNGDITIDALWEIFRASIPKDTNDYHVISFLISTLQMSEDYPKLSEISITSDCSLSKAVKNSATKKLDKMPTNLEEVKIIFNP